jgi:hypothetical protein
VDKEILINAQSRTGQRGKQSKLAVISVKEGEVPHWTVVPSKEVKKKKSIVCVYYRILLSELLPFVSLNVKCLLLGKT